MLWLENIDMSEGPYRCGVLIDSPNPHAVSFVRYTKVQRVEAWLVPCEMLDLDTSVLVSIQMPGITRTGTMNRKTTFLSALA